MAYKTQRASYTHRTFIHGHSNEYIHEHNKRSHASTNSTKATLADNNDNGMCANVSLNDEPAWLQQMIVVGKKPYKKNVPKETCSKRQCVQIRASLLYHGIEKKAVLEHVCVARCVCLCRDEGIV